MAAVADGGGRDETQAVAESRQVQVRFVTKLPAELRVPPGVIAVPARLTRNGLSEVINALLATEEPRPFDFLVDGELLRTSLEKLLLLKKLSAESTLSIEYIPAVVPPKLRDARPHDDWVSAVSCTQSGDVISGSYDGLGRIWREEGTCWCTLAGHTDAITSLAVPQTEAQAGADDVIFTASKDRRLRQWQVAPRSSKTDGTRAELLSATHIYEGHKASVQSVAASPADSTEVQLCSGSWDATIMVWPMGGPPDEEAAAAAAAAAPKKSRKGAAGAAAAAAAPPQPVSSKATLEGHTQCVSAVAWAEPGTIVSASWDHSIRTWDASTGINTLTLTGSKPVFCLSAEAKGGGLLATGGADSALRIWDPRANVTPVLQLTAHKGWISAVSWSKASPFHLLSASHDTSVKLWDTRSKSEPLYTLDDHKDKVLCAAWCGNDSVASGGADRQLRIFRGTGVH